MIIGVTHVQDNPNHELIELLDQSKRFQLEPLIGPKPLLANVLDLLVELSDEVLCYGVTEPLVVSPKIEYRDLLMEGANNATSLFYVCRKHRHEVILYVPSHLICSDWEQLKKDITEAIRVSVFNNQFTILTTSAWTGPDPTVSWVSNGHYVANLQGLEKSHELLYHAQAVADNFRSNLYEASTGICVFPSKQVFNIIKQTMPKYWEWIVNSQWENVNALSFEQAVLENIHSFKTVRTDTVTVPGNHYYQIFQFIRARHKLKTWPTEWTVFDNNGFYEIAIRHIDSHQTNVELLPGTYFIHGIMPKESLTEVVFKENTKTYRKFQRGIELMRIRKLR